MVEVGLPLPFICDLVLKLLYFNGNMLGRNLAATACLPWALTAKAVGFLTKEDLCGTTGARGHLGNDEKFTKGLEHTVTEAGRERTRKSLRVSQYLGPAPVPIEDYLASARELVTEAGVVAAASLEQALGELVLRHCALSQTRRFVCHRQF
jgi:hypothetical protein